MRPVDSTLCDTRFPNDVGPIEPIPLSTVYPKNNSEDPFETISLIFPTENENTRFWWHTTGVTFAQMLKRAPYPIHQQYRYLVFFYLIVLPEFGPAPFITEDPTHTTAQVSFGVPFRSYMTDDHSPIELSWLFDSEKGVVTRFAIDPVRRQMEGDPRGPMGLFEDLGRSNLLAPGVDLDWCRVCANSLTLSSTPRLGDVEATPEYPSQYFIGFDLSSPGIVMKAYFLPETRAAVTSTTKSALITSCIVALSTPTSKCPNPPDLLTSWKRTLSFFASLPSDLAPSLPIVAVDCVPACKNRIKVYARTPLSTLANIRRFLTLGRDVSYTTATTQRALEQITTLWHLLFPALSDPENDNVESPCLQHLTGGLLFYYELRPGYAEPLPKVYLPVRHWCDSDEQVVRIMEAFYAKTGKFKAAECYGRDVRDTFTHRPLSARAGIHTYITFAIKPNDVEITSYFNPECYAEERVPLY